MIIRIPKKSTPASSEITPESVYLDRRRFIGASVALGAAAALSPGDLAARVPRRPGPRQELGPVAFGEELRDELNTWEQITSYNNFYEFGTDKGDPMRNSGDFEPEPWTVEVTGHVKHPGTYSVEDLARPGQVEDRIYRLRCVEAWSMVIPWRGVPFQNVISRLEPTGDAKYVAFETVYRPSQMPGQRRPILDWPYVEGLRIDEAANPLTFLVTGLYGRDLPNQNGAPLRLVVPWKYGFKGIKSIVRISFVEDMPLNTWRSLQPQEYGFYANVNPEVDHPRWSQARERRLPNLLKNTPTVMFNGYAEEVGHLYRGMDLRKWY